MIRALLAVGFFLINALASQAGELDWVERRVGDLGILLPTGAGWQLEEGETGGWQAVRVQRNAVGEPKFFYTILVDPHQFPDIFSDWLPIEVSTDYLQWEIQNMRTEGVDKGEFNLLELDVYEEKHGALTLHVLRNVKDFIEPWHPKLTLEAQELYLVFLPNFADTVTFYKVFISADCFFESCRVADLKLSEMYPLLDNLRDHSETPE